MFIYFILFILFILIFGLPEKLRWNKHNFQCLVWLEICCGMGAIFNVWFG
jgi:hypothetical protein